MNKRAPSQDSNKKCPNGAFVQLEVVEERRCPNSCRSRLFFLLLLMSQLPLKRHPAIRLGAMFASWCAVVHESS